MEGHKGFEHCSFRIFLKRVATNFPSTSTLRPFEKNILTYSQHFPGCWDFSCLKTVRFFRFFGLEKHVVGVAHLMWSTCAKVNSKFAFSFFPCRFIVHCSPIRPSEIRPEKGLQSFPRFHWSGDCRFKSKNTVFPKKSGEEVVDSK